MIDENVGALIVEVEKSTALSQHTKWVLDNMFFTHFGTEGERYFGCVNCGKPARVPVTFDATVKEERESAVCSDKCREEYAKKMEENKNE